jgi:glycosyltransferase involved in cell wall biosynthesis
MLHKNIGRLLAAFERVEHERKGLYLYLCIAGYQRRYLNSLIPAQLREKVIKIPYVPQKKMAAFYRGAPCLVSPSLHESFGISAVEAMVSGCPVVVSRCSALPEICQDATLYCSPLDVNDLVDKIGQILGDNDLRDNLRRKGLERAKAFDWKETALQIFRILRAV